MEPNEHTKLELIQAQVSFIPEGWRLDKVGTTLKIRNSLRKPISQEARSKIQGKYPYYGPTRIQDYISEYEQDGEFALIGEDGDHFLKYSTMQQTQFISGRCTVNNHAHIIEGTTKCDSEWFYIFFKHRNITNFLSRQGAGRFKLNKATLEKLPMLVPPLPEQRKIAKILSTWDKAISTTERLIDNSKQQKQALMQQLLTGKKRLLDDSGKPFEGEWEEYYVKDFGLVVTGNTPSKSDEANYGTEFSWATAEDFRGKYISNTKIKLSSQGVKSARMVPKGSVLVTCIASIGKNAIANEEMATNQQINAVKVNKNHCNEFLYYLIENNRHKLIAWAGTTAVPILNKSSFEKIKLKAPSIIEQRKIASVLSNADRESELLEQQLADLKQEKKALMQQLLTGKRRVKVDDDVLE
jgi:type I restriction enzyme S subunit